MYLAFSQDDQQLGEGFALLLKDHPARRLMHGSEQAGVDLALWQAMARDGWLAAGLPESVGGSGLSAAALCALCERAGEALVAVSLPPLLAVQRLLSRCDGSAAAAALAASSTGEFRPLLVDAEDWRVAPTLAGADRGLDGETTLLADAADATVLLTLARRDAERILLLLDRKYAVAETPQGGILDLLHPPARWCLREAPVTILARGAEAERLFAEAQYEQAVFTAFEQVGGAAAALETARRYALGRFAFGRAIASFQAIKHSLADVLAELELGRSNAYFGAASLSDRAKLEEAACVSRLSATQAYQLAARTSIQVHGAIGVTWEHDGHLHYRRSQALALAQGGLEPWRERLVRLLIERGKECH